jgi:hypothetical protein
MVVMAANGNGAEQAYTPVLTAMSTMRDGMREQKEAAHVYLESFQKSVRCFYTALRLTPQASSAHESQTEAWQMTIGILQSGADAEAKLFAATTLKGKVIEHNTRFFQSEAYHPDYLRHPTNTYRCPTILTKSNFGAFEGLCSGAATDQDPAMCLLGTFSHTNDRVEGCYANGYISVGQHSREPCLYSGFPESSSRRGHPRTQDQFDCMWAERHHPASINDLGWAREYLYQNLMRHIRKKSFLRELRSC